MANRSPIRQSRCAKSRRQTSAASFAETFLPETGNLSTVILGEVSPRRAPFDLRDGSWSCKNAVAEALTPWGFGDVAVHGHFRNLTVFRTESAADKDSSHLGWFCNDRLLRAGGYALIAAMSGLVPMMFMTRVRL
jgi:hypothetical protein